MIGRTIGQYQIIDKIGEGGMGTVYKAEDTTLHRLVALKTLSGHLTEDEEAQERFIREAQAASALNHPNITTVHEFIEDDDTRLICMEYVEGKTIRDMVETGTVSVRKAIDIIMQAAEALDAAHNKGILHRDVKSANIMVNMEGRVKVMDFGLAHLEGKSQLTRTGTTMGTLSYSSPEQISGRTVDRRSEIFSLGVVFYELLTGQLPFKASNEAEILFAIVNNEPPKVSKLRDDVPELVEAVVSRMLEKDSELRYQTCADVIHDLQGIRRAMETSTVGITGVLEQVQAGKRKMLVTRIGIGVVALAVIAVGTQLLLPRQPQLDPYLVVVLPFQNQTGDPEFDRVCALAGDEIARGLGVIDFISVVPYRTSREIADALRGAESSMTATERIDRLCKETGAGTVVTGTLYLLPEEELLQIKVDISDQTSGRLLGIPREATGPRVEPQGMLDAAKDRVMAELATLLDPRLEGQGSLITPIQTYRAYQLFHEGSLLFSQRRYPEAIDSFLQGAAIDSISPIPLIRATVAYSNQGRYAEAESLMTVLVPYRDRYTEFEQCLLDWLVSNTMGDQVTQYETATALAEMSPTSMFLYLAGWECLTVNRPGEAVRYLTRISSYYSIHSPWWPFWTVLATSYHMLEDYRDELAAAREARALFPHNWDVRVAEIRALAALGRTDEISALVEDSESLPYTLDTTPAWLMCTAGLELRERGDEEEAQVFFERALQWYRSQSEADQEVLQFSIAWTLYHAERWEEAREILEALQRQDPSSVSVAGLLGRLAARRGDREAAIEYQAHLEDLGARGSNRYEQAAIAALLGEKETAVSLLRRSFQEGRAHGLILHTDFDFFSLRDFGPFREWLAPDG